MIPIQSTRFLQPNQAQQRPPTPFEDLLGDALERALALYAEPARYGAVQQRGMGRDFSWEVAAAGYETLYREAL